ncbi:hypothetical protein [Cerasicoccus fimbriatus]|uniref:hypothetical protein n=1 Tax=Cerasicoccus fimbriatus TaxID=3014554 RepID=UPI0022B3DDB4|nr:hypothetical protein [Cerasicoccus sp. TK19100]
MRYNTRTLLTATAFASLSLASLDAAKLIEFTFDASNINETTGYLPNAPADHVIVTSNPDTGFFTGTGGITIFQEITSPFSAGMSPSAAPGYGATSVGTTPTSPGFAVFTGIAQFSFINDTAPDLPDAPNGYKILPDSLTVAGTGTNLQGIVIRNSANQSIFLTTGAPANGPFSLTFDISGWNDIAFTGGESESYSLFLVGSSGGSPVGAQFTTGDNITFYGDVVPIPEPSVYLAGASAILLGSFLYVRRRKKSAKQES